MIKVGMADLNVCTAPEALTTLGLGSCIGACIYDPVMKVAGLVHYMLPDSTRIKNNENIAKFGDTGIIETINRMEKLGAKRSRMVAKIAGGAKMFATNACKGSDIMNVGIRNVEATKEILSQLKINILAEDTGLNYGRTIVFDSVSGELVIRAVGKPEKTI